MDRHYTSAASYNHARIRYTGAMDRPDIQRDAILNSLQASAPGLPADVVRDFVSRMDDEYFQRFQPADIVRHLRLVERLTPDHPCHVSVTECDGGLLLAVVAYDYFSEFAAIAGLLSSHRLDIREGALYTYTDASGPAGPRSAASGRRPQARPGLSRKKIVDVFLVRPLPGSTFGPAEQRTLAVELEQVIRLLDARQFTDARRFVNRRLVETLGKARGAFHGLLAPVQIRFDNTVSTASTAMDIRSTDTPAFLYAFALALSMRGLYIHQARFEHVGDELHDRFFVRGRNGRKIEGRTEQQELLVTATLAKQFTQHLIWAPDPTKALESFDQFLDQLFRDAQGKKTLAFLSKKATLPLLARLLGTSEYLWEDFVRRQHANLLPILDAYRDTPLVRSRRQLAHALRRQLARARTDDRRRTLLNRFKDQELFRIDMKHLLDRETSLPDFSLALTNLAEIILEQAVHDCSASLARRHGAPRLGRRPCPFAIFAMGKFGGRELGYASDIEVLFVYGGQGRTSGRQPLDHSEYYERLVYLLLQWIESKQEGIFRLDVRLRPHGGKGLLANTVDELCRYYSPSGLAAPFERQALTKLRFVCGDPALGRRVETHRDAFVYSGQPWDLAAALSLRRQQIRELVEPGRVNVKYSPGGIVDIEYTAQYLQVMHGHAIPDLRTPNTLEALAEAERLRILPAREAHALHEAYLFLRSVIDALRIVRGHAKDLVLPDTGSDEFIFLARRMGYTEDDWQGGANKLAADIARHMKEALTIYTRRFIEKAG
jgi:glutamate-ammonia-ligase adenylyltransferase